MSIRNRTKDVGLALLRLDKLPLKLRRKSTVGGSRYSSPKDANYEKCKHIIEKSFSNDREHLMRVTTINKDGRNDKLETIVEHPLVEAEPRIEGLDVPPKLFGTERFKQPSDRVQKNFDVKLKALDDLALELMNVPPSQIDSKLLDTCTRDVETSRTYPIVENLDCDVPGYSKKTVEELNTEEDKDSLYIDKYTNLTPLSYRSYNLHLESDLGQKSFKAEKSYPSHLDAVFKMSAKENLEQDLHLNMPINREFVSYNMLIPPPLPPNETSISSQMTYENDGYRRDRTMPSYMREKQMAISNTPELTTVQDETQYKNYLSTLSGSTSIHGDLDQRKIRSRKSSKHEIPLSQLLKQVRQKNKIMQELNNKKLKFNVSPFLSKSTCLPPLDLRPRSATCPPRACPPRKEEEPPKKSMPCPPPKKSPCPPAKKDPCPAEANPCDPCKPPPACPAPKNPCNMYTGNKFKDTITLILCGFNPFNILRLAFGLPLLWNYSYNLVQDTNRSVTTTSVANSKALRMKYFNESSNDPTEDQSKIHFLEFPKPEQNTRDMEGVYFARSYEPWSPIPSWPMATKKEKKKLVCPKDGCKLPQVSPSKPCKEFPCSFNAADRKR